MNGALSTFWYIILHSGSSWGFAVRVRRPGVPWGMDQLFVPLMSFSQSQNLLPASVSPYALAPYGRVSYGQLAPYALLYAFIAVALYTLVRFFCQRDHWVDSQRDN